MEIGDWGLRVVEGTPRAQSGGIGGRLREVWGLYKETQRDPRLVWSAHLLDVAKRIAKGEREVAVERMLDETQVTYARRIQRLQSQYPVVAFGAANRRPLAAAIAATGAAGGEGRGRSCSARRHAEPIVARTSVSPSTS